MRRLLDAAGGAILAWCRGSRPIDQRSPGEESPINAKNDSLSKWVRGLFGCGGAGGVQKLI